MSLALWLRAINIGSDRRGRSGDQPGEARTACAFVFFAAAVWDAVVVGVGTSGQQKEEKGN